MTLHLCPKSVACAGNYCAGYRKICLKFRRYNKNNTYYTHFWRVLWVVGFVRRSIGSDRKWQSSVASISALHLSSCAASLTYDSQLARLSTTWWCDTHTHTHTTKRETWYVHSTIIAIINMHVMDPQKIDVRNRCLARPHARSTGVVSLGVKSFRQPNKNSPVLSMYAQQSDMRHSMQTRNTVKPTEKAYYYTFLFAKLIAMLTSNNVQKAISLL